MSMLTIAKTVISVVAGVGTSVTSVTGGFDVDLGQGVIVHVLSDGTYTVDAPQSLSATDVLSGSFTYTVQDDGGAQSTATVNVTVNGANDDPAVSGNATATIDEDDIGPLMVDLLDNVSDVDIGDVLSVGAVTQDVGNSDRDLGGAFTVTGTELSFDPNIFNDLDETDTETLTFTYTVSDNHGGSVSQTLVITITGTDDAAVITADETGAVSEGDIGDAETVTGAIAVSDVDGDDDPSFAGAAAAGLYGAIAVNAAGDSWTYTLDQSTVQDLDAGDIVTDTVTLTDDEGNTVDIVITITGTDDAAVITADETGAVSEGDIGDAETATGAIAVSDVDGDDDPSFAGAAAAGLYGAIADRPLH